MYGNMSLFICILYMEYQKAAESGKTPYCGTL